ncbi:Protein CBR-bath-44 [Rhizophlyctis rosea]|nr:Protein CBR-bath-44 [Rhizophlyctis rosea]
MSDQSSNNQPTYLDSDPAAQPVVFTWTVDGIGWKHEQGWGKTSNHFEAFGHTWKLRCRTEQPFVVPNVLTCPTKHGAGCRLKFGAFLHGVDFPASSVTGCYEVFVMLPSSQFPFKRVKFGMDCRTLLSYNGYGSIWIDSAIFINRGKLPSQLTVGVVIYPAARPTHHSSRLPPDYTTIPHLHQSGNRTTVVAGYPTNPRLGDILKSGEAGDFTFRIGERSIAAHCGILLAHAPDSYFSSVLMHPMQERTNREAIVQDTSYNAFYALLELLYAGQTDVQDIETLADLYRAADKYQLPTLVDMAKCQLHHHLRTATLNQEITIFGKIYCMQDADDLKIVCLRYMLEDWEEVQELEEWQEVSCMDGVLEEIMRLISVCNRFGVEVAKG